MKLRQKIDGLVFANGYRHALFHNFPGGLRFELSEGGYALDQILTALRKATIICDDVFHQRDSILVHLQRFAPPSRFEMRETLRELARAGIPIPAVRDIWIEQSSEESEEDEDLLYIPINVAFELPKSKLQNLLWCAIASNFWCMGPDPQCRVYLIDPAQQLIVHPYDSRGMDIIGGNKEALKRLFIAHNGWLLNYNIEAMNQTFLGTALHVVPGASQYSGAICYQDVPYDPTSLV